MTGKENAAFKKSGKNKIDTDAIRSGKIQNVVIETDASLIKKISRGDRDAFASLVSNYQDRALRIAYLHTNRWEDAEEIAQDAFIKVFKNIRRFRGEAKFSTWFYRILINQCYDCLRKRKTKDALSVQLGSDPKKDILSQIPGNDHPRKAVLNKELKEKIDREVNLLPEQQKTVFILHYHEKEKLKSIAGILKTTEGSVKTNLFRAREKLKKALGDSRDG